MRRGRGREFQDDFNYLIEWLVGLIDDYEDRKLHKGSLNLGITFERGLNMQAIPASGSDVESIPLSISPKNAAGGDVSGGTYIWKSSDESIVGLKPSADGLTCLALSVADGTATVSVSDGNLTDTIDITWTPAKANALNLSAGVPIPE